MNKCESKIVDKCTDEGKNELPDGRHVCDACLPFVTGGQAIIDLRNARLEEAVLAAAGQMRWD